MNPAALSEEDQTLFARAMADVLPIRGDGSRAARPSGNQAPAPPPLLMRPRSREEDNFLAQGHAELVDAQAVLSFRRNGVQHGVFRHLKQGGYDIEAVLDLRPLRVEQARQALYRFINDCLRQDVRLALVKHGRGGRLGDKPAVIKSQVARWLPQFPQVVAFHSARKRHGGVSAVYVMLYKSEKQRELTRLRLGLASGKPDGWQG